MDDKRTSAKERPLTAGIKGEATGAGTTELGEEEKGAGATEGPPEASMEA